MMNASKKLLAMLAFAPMAFSAHANLLTNGSFENGLAGWQDTCGTPGHFDCGTGSSWWFPAPIDGSMDFYGYDNDTTGVLSQSFVTTPGQQYQVEFQYQTTDPLINTLSYGFGGEETSFSLLPTTEWQHMSDLFTATATTTTLAFFYATIPGSGTLRLDAVSVTAVPEPGTWALALLGCGLCSHIVRRQRKAD